MKQEDSLCFAKQGYRTLLGQTTGLCSKKPEEEVALLAKDNQAN